MRIETKGLGKIYNKRIVVKGVSFNISQGEVVGLLGANGAGKTTSFYMVVGVVRPSMGNIYLDDQEITGLPMYKGLFRNWIFAPGSINFQENVSRR